MRARLFALAMVAAMLASTLLPTVAAENTTSDDADENRQLQADPPDCPDWAGLEAWTAAAEAELAAEIAADALPHDQVVVVAGEGGTVSATPEYLVAKIVLDAAKEALLGIEISKEFYLHCENEAHWELLQLVDDKIDELTTITETDDTENNRIEIENALYPCTPLVGFYLPTANGGQIETVAEVVQEAIDGSQASGFNVTGAQNTHNNAVNTMNAGAYRDAFIGFCSAYGQLISSSGGGNSTNIARTYGTGYINFCVSYYTGAVTESRVYNAQFPLVDPSTLCKSTEKAIQVLGWTYAR